MDRPKAALAANLNRLANQTRTSIDSGPDSNQEIVNMDLFKEKPS